MEENAGALLLLGLSYGKLCKSFICRRLEHCLDHTVCVCACVGRDAVSLAVSLVVIHSALCVNVASQGLWWWVAIVLV